MRQFTEIQAKEFKNKASKEMFFTEFTWYNSFLKIKYTIPITQFKGFKLPQWSNVLSLEPINNDFVITITLFNDGNLLYDINTALKNEIITFLK